MSEKETLTTLGSLEGVCFKIKGMAVGGNETQILCEDEIGVVKAVLWVHEDETCDWLNPPKEPYKTKYETFVKKLLKERGDL